MSWNKRNVQSSPAAVEPRWGSPQLAGCPPLHPWSKSRKTWAIWPSDHDIHVFLVENVGKCGKMWENVGKCGKMWENEMLVPWTLGGQTIFRSHFLIWKPAEFPAAGDVGDGTSVGVTASKPSEVPVTAQLKFLVDSGTCPKTSVYLMPSVKKNKVKKKTVTQ